MTSEILHTSYVIDFLDVDFDSAEIGKSLQNETDLLLKTIKNETVEDWTVRFNVVYGNKSQIWLYKSMPSYTKEKIKPVTIHIPIPTSDIVNWGVHPSQHIKVGAPPSDKGFTKLEVDYSKFIDRNSFIKDCLRRAIKCLLEEGITLNGEKIKLKK